MGVRAYIGIASNIEPEVNVVRALELLARRAQVVAVSSIYRTPAISRPEQPEYLNGACLIETELDARFLKFGVLREVEAEMGRVRGHDAYAPQTIDLDLVLYGELVCDEDGLRLPDPDILTRPFLAASLLEIEGGIVMPDSGIPLRELVNGQALERLRRDEAITRLVKERLHREPATN